MFEIILQVGVKVLLKNPKGKYLLVKRSAVTYPNAICGWEPVGGRITAGIPLLENLEREVKEETGITIIKNIKLIAAQDILRVEGKHIVRLTYVADTEDEPVELDSENSEYIWIKSEEIQNLDNLDPYLNELVHNRIIDL